ncbi:hypothetical protein OC195_02005 [Priestia flexa]|nr:hypothetical protein OC195_02005 [Priestia flexa]
MNKNMNAVGTILKLLLVGIIVYGLIFFVQKNWYQFHLLVPA